MFQVFWDTSINNNLPLTWDFILFIYLFCFASRNYYILEERRAILKKRIICDLVLSEDLEGKYNGN